MLKLINETVDFLKKKGFESTEIGIILGTGLGQLINEIEIIYEVNYNQIPNFPCWDFRMLSFSIFEFSNCQFPSFPFSILQIFQFLHCQSLSEDKGTGKVAQLLWWNRGET